MEYDLENVTLHFTLYSLKIVTGILTGNPILMSLGMSGFRSSPGDSDEEFESVSQVTGPVSNTFHLLT